MTQAAGAKPGCNAAVPGSQSQDVSPGDTASLSERKKKQNKKNMVKIKPEVAGEKAV